MTQTPSVQMQQGNGTVPQALSAQDNIRTDKERRKTCWWHAYGATLVEMTIVVHIVASIVTVVLYTLFPPSAHPLWFAPVVGAFGTYFVFLVIAAICCTSIATVESANKRSYGLLKTRLWQIKARLDGIEEYQ